MCIQTQLLLLLEYGLDRYIQTSETRVISVLQHSAKELKEVAKTEAAAGLAAKQSGKSKKGRVGMLGGELGREVALQLFKKWVRSDDRDKVESYEIWCKYDMGGGRTRAWGGDSSFCLGFCSSQL